MKKCGFLFLAVYLSNPLSAFAHGLCEMSSQVRSNRIAAIERRIENTAKLDLKAAQDEVGFVRKELNKKKNGFFGANVTLLVSSSLLFGAGAVIASVAGATVGSSGALSGFALSVGMNKKEEAEPSTGMEPRISMKRYEEVRNFLYSPDCGRDRCSMNYPGLTDILEKIEEAYEKKVEEIMDKGHYVPQLISQTKLKLIRDAELPRSLTRLVVRKEQIRYYEMLKEALMSEQKVCEGR